MPHDYKQGSNIYPHIHWAPTTDATTNRVEWVLEYQWVNLGGTYAATTADQISGYLVVGDVGSPTETISAREHTITPMGSGGITGLDKNISSVLMCRLYRNGTGSNDTYTSSAALLSLDLHYEIDSFGSSSEYTK